VNKESTVSAKSIRPRLLTALVGLAFGVVLLSGCGTGQKQAENYGDLKAAFMEGCRETAAADAKTDESATLPSNFCQCAFDELSDEKTGVDFDELMEINEELTNADGPGKLPAEVTKVFADCGK